MTNLATVLKDEIRRLARKEVRSETAQTRRHAVQHRRDIAALKRQVHSLTREVATLRRQERRRTAAPAANGTAAADARAVRFSPGWVEKHRARLELSAADYAALVGVSPLTIYNWEKGKTRPRGEQLARWAAIRDLGKREAWKRLESLEA